MILIGFVVWLFTVFWSWASVLDDNSDSLWWFIKVLFSTAWTFVIPVVAVSWAIAIS